MRVLHVINRFSTSGAETSLRELIEATISEVVHGVVVLHEDRNRFDHEAIVEHFVPSGRLSGYRGRVRHVRHAIELFKPELVHTTLFEASTAGRIAARLADVPVLTSLVSTPYVPSAMVDRHMKPWKHRLVRHVDRILSRHATTHFHAITQAVADSYVSEFGLAPDAITVVPRGRSRQRLGEPSASRRQEARRGLGLATDQPVILSVGRQEAPKGHRYLLEAAPAIVRARPGVHFLIAGRSGAVTEALEHRLDELGLRDTVSMLGLREDVGDLLAMADLFVFPSLYEGLGGAVLEAMAMRLPIVASDVPALREVLDHGRCGVLVPPADPDALAAACLAMLSSPERAADLANAAHARFEAHYTGEAATRGMLDLYRRLVVT